MTLRWLRCSAAAIVVAVCTPALSGDAVPQRSLTEIPNPDVSAQLAAFQPADGFEITLFAAEPQISKPIQMSFDAAGRLWVVGSDLYPQIQPGERRADKVYLLEDTDGDGRAERSTVFADNLLIPTGILPDDTSPHLAAYVASSSEILYLEDTDGDRVSDRSRVVLSGFGTEDTHHLIHSFRWGPAGHLYFTQSIYIHSHVETPWGVRRLLGGGVWRYDPKTMKLDVFARGGINMWGHHFDRYGQSFLTDGASAQGINFAFPGATYETAVGADRVLRGLNPGQPKQAGLEVITGRHLPERWQGRFITHDFRGNRVNSFEVEPSGSGYVSRQTEDLVVSTHRAFRPVDVRMGPDGAVYIADWYNPIIQHGEVDFRDPRRDRAHGRIWRVAATGRPLVERRDLTRASLQELLEALSSPEQFTREMARPLLSRHGGAAVLPALDAWASKLDASDPVQAPLVLEALWVRAWLDAPDAALLERALKSGDAHVRAGAVRVAADWADRLPAPLAIYERAVGDPHPQVRLEAVNALRITGTAEAARIAVAAADHPLDANLDFALWLTLRDLRGAWMPRLAADPAFFGSDPRPLITALRSAGRPEALAPLLALWRAGDIPDGLRQPALELLGDVGGPNELRLLYDLALDAGEAASDRVSMLEALRRAASRKLRPSGDLQSIIGLTDGSPPDIQVAALRLAGAWGMEAIGDAAARAAVSDVSELRAAALQALVDLGSAGRPTLVQLASAGPVDRRAEAATALARTDIAAAAPIVAEILSSNEGAGIAAAALIAPFLTQKQGAAALAQALTNRKVPVAAARELLRAISTSGMAAPDLAAVIESASGIERLVAMPSGDALADLIRTIDVEGDAARGEEVYRRSNLLCTSCHAVAGAGGAVGPDLTSIGASAPLDYLVESLLDPQARVKEGYQVLTITRRDGTVIAGVPVRDGAGEVALRDGGDNVIAVPAADIASRVTSQASLMPPGLAAQLRRDELLDLLKFLSVLGRTDGVTASRAPVVRRWRILAADSAVSARLREQGMGYAARPDAELPWRPAYSTAAGTLPLSDVPVVSYFGQQRYRVVRFEVEAAEPASATFRLGAASGLSLWLDGQVVNASAPDVTLDLAAGRHLVTVAVDMSAYSGPALRVELVSAGPVLAVSGK